MGVGLQCFTAVASSFGTFIMAALSVWPSYTLDLYTSPNTTLLSHPMTKFESSLVGSVPALGAMVGTAVSNLIIDRIGRQKGGVAMCLPFILSWLIISCTRNSVVIIIARFISGTSGGAFLVLGPLFISEVAQDSIRGALASGPILFNCLGAVISYLLGWFLTYQMVIWANLALSIFCALLCFFVVESPLFLLRQNREEDAKQAMAKYRSLSPTSKDILDEISRLKDQITPRVELVDNNIQDDKEKKEEEAEKEKLQPDVDNNETQKNLKLSPMKLLFVSPSAKRAFGVVGTALCMQVLMGIVPVLVYAKNLFAVATPSWSSHFCSVLLGVILTSGCVVTTLVADKAGRRVLIIFSCAMVGVCMTTLAVLIQISFEPAFVSAIVILVYCFFFNLGAGSVPYVLLAEVFSPEVQGFASMLLIQVVWFLNFAIIAIFPFAASILGIHGVFYFFAATAFTNAVISFFRVPETKGLSNQEIQEKFLK